MPLTVGSRLGPYEVLAPLGAGGMGEVYRARDARLGREVAVKVLPGQVAADAERRSRFEQEARAASALNHPGIVTVYDVGADGGTLYVAMELVEGRTLREQLADGPLSTKKLLDLAVQVADALAKAHAAGIVHRDLKPENLIASRDGFVKVLDFGLAKLTTSQAAPQVSHLPTLPRHESAPGTVLGTVGYMSPEQASGQAVDFRSDQFSLGAILYEAATARRAFQGKSSMETLAAILRDEPEPLAPQNPRLPAPLRWIIERCLAKDPEDRYQSTRDLARELRGVRDHLSDATSSADAGLAAGTAPRRRRLRDRVTLALGLACLAGSLVVAGYASRTRNDDRVLTFELNAPAGTDFALHRDYPGPAVVSPDGRSLAFCAESGGTARLYLRRLEARDARLLEGTEGAYLPFWAPDSRSIGFGSGGKLRRVDVAGGAPVALCDAPDFRGGSWSPEGVIIFAPTYSSPIMRVASTGGEPSPVTHLDKTRKDDSHRYPRFLPDGRHFVYLVREEDVKDEKLVAIDSLDGGPQKILMRSPAAVEYVAGNLVFLRDSTLTARPFDAKRLEFAGEAFPVAENVRLIGVDTALAAFSASGGTLAYQPVSVLSRKLTWRDRTGREIGTLGDEAAYSEVALSPKGDYAAVVVGDNKDIWIYEVARNLRTRFTFDKTDESLPAWSADGAFLAFSNSGQAIYRQPLRGSGSAELLIKADRPTLPFSFSPDGQTLAFFQYSHQTNFDLWMLPLNGDRKPYVFLQTPYEELGPLFSPDGRWIAFVSDESGREEVYVTAFPKPGRKWQVSTQGGVFPSWRADCREIIYQTRDGSLMAAGIEARGSDLVVGAAKALFKTKVVSQRGYAYSVAPDGQKFLVIESTTDERPQPLTVVVNWLAGAKR